MLDREKINSMREQLRTGVRVVSAPQLFPTPPDLAARMVKLADIQAGHHVLEPSAGTGRILDQLVGRGAIITAVELNISLANALAEKYPTVTVLQEDFLNHDGDYDRVVMNPPFKDAADIQHIRHAYSLLKPGGVLVALCAAGPRQCREFSDTGDYWEVLPTGTFSDEGTGVHAALLILRK